MTRHSYNTHIPYTAIPHTVYRIPHTVYHMVLSVCCMPLRCALRVSAQWASTAECCDHELHGYHGLRLDTLRDPHRPAPPPPALPPLIRHQLPATFARHPYSPYPPPRPPHRTRRRERACAAPPRRTEQCRPEGSIIYYTPGHSTDHIAYTVHMITHKSAARNRRSRK